MKISKNTSLSLGVPFLKDLPKGAKRTFKIFQNSPDKVQSIESIAEFIITKLESDQLNLDKVFLITGFPYKSCFETDGPLGTVYLSEIFLKMEKKVFICAEKDLLAVMKKLYIQTDRRSKNKKLEFLNTNQIKDFSNSMVITIEYPGANKFGICHSMRGENISSKFHSIEKLFEKPRNFIWISIGDGGNELGMGELLHATEKIIPFGKTCICGCGGGIAAEKISDRAILTLTSNVGALMLSKEIASQKKIDWIYSIKNDYENLEILNKNEILDGVSGKMETIDSIPKSLRKKMIRNIFLEE